MKKLFVMLAVTAALCLSADSLRAQDNGGGGGGGGFGGGGRGGRGNFDPAQFQQRMMDRYRDDLGFTNDTDWSAVQPLIQKVMDDRRQTMMGMFGGFRRRGGNNDNGGGNRPPGMSFPERDALQQAIDSNAPSPQVAAALDKYRAAVKTRQAKLEADQADLAKVLTPKQEAQAVLGGLLN